MELQDMALGIVIVTYKSYDRIKDYVELDLLPSHLPLNVIVVDVGSERCSAERLAEILGVSVTDVNDVPPTGWGNVIVLHSRENLGYARGNNYGARYILQHFPDTKYLLFSNDDVRFLKGPVLEQLVERLHDCPDIGIIGPDILDAKGDHQWPIYDDIPVTYYIVNNLCEPFFGAGYANRFFQFPSGQPKDNNVKTLSGCFMMVKAETFCKAGMFDERTFLYWEECILSKRMEAIGKRIFFDDSVQIRHLVGASMKRGGGPNLLLLKSMLAGQMLYYRYYDWCGWPTYALLTLSKEIRLFLVYLVILKRRLKSCLGLTKDGT